MKFQKKKSTKYHTMKTLTFDNFFFVVGPFASLDQPYRTLTLAYFLELKA
jgi:hypothetical protein